MVDAKRQGKKRTDAEKTALTKKSEETFKTNVAKGEKDMGELTAALGKAQ